MLMIKQQLNFKHLLVHVAAFDNTAGWKMNTEGTAVEINDGNPVWIGADGKEMVVKGDTLNQLRGEATNHRTAKEAAEAKLKEYDGLDAKAAREAIEKLKGVDLTKMIESGKLDEVKSQLTKEFNNQITEKDKAYGDLNSKYESLLINNVFNGSEFVRNNLAIPQDMFQAYFRDSFKIENGQIAAYGKDGNRLMSKKNVGEFATPEEALELLVDMHPQKDIILKADLGRGSGSNGGGGNAGGIRNIRRSEFEKLPAIKQAEISSKVRNGEIKLID